MSYVKLSVRGRLILFEVFNAGQERGVAERLERAWTANPDAIGGICGAALAELEGLPQVGDTAADVDGKSFSGSQELLLSQLAREGGRMLPLEQLKTAKSLEKHGYVAMCDTWAGITWRGRNAYSIWRRVERASKALRDAAIAEREAAK